MVFNGTHYGTLKYHKGRREFKMRLKQNTPRAIRPSIIYGSVVMQSSLKPKDYAPTSEEIYRWICDRTIPQNRQNIGNILSNNGLQKYIV